MDLTRGIVRVLKPDGTTSGTGFVVSEEGLIATCAHVVEINSTLPAYVNIVFHYTGEMAIAKTVKEWYRASNAEDVVILQLQDTLPRGVLPLILGDSSKTQGQVGYTFGFPKEFSLEGLNGKWEIIAPVTLGGVQVLQLRGPEITVGFSGAPILCASTSLVVGMITAIATEDEFHKLSDTAFITPSETLNAICPLLKLNQNPGHEGFEYLQSKGSAQLLDVAVPFQAPGIPAHFVERRQVTNVVKQGLLSHGEFQSGTLVVSAIQGLGGIGKTTLAIAIAHDASIKAAFPDGLLWVTLGQKPNIIVALQNWIEVLGDQNTHLSTEQAASAHLRTLLYSKSMLLVVDDVWESVHAEAFMVGGPMCRILITTRRSVIADDIGANLIPLDVMKPEESLSLLEHRMRRQLSEAEREEALALANVVGNLPLALELAAVQIRKGKTWQELCIALSDELARLDVLEDSRRALLGQNRLEATFNLSLARLRDEFVEGWEAFASLGILAEDVAITSETVATLWQTEREHAQRILEYLADEGLILVVSVPTYEGNRNNVYRQHDLLQDIAKWILTRPKPVGLGRTLALAHKQLIDYYASTCTGDASEPTWHKLSYDGYIHDHLGWHMQQANLADTLIDLLQEETADGRNGWFTACEAIGKPAIFVSDVERAWETIAPATNLADHDEMTLDKIGLEARFALLTSSVHDLAKNINPYLLQAVVECSIWQPSQALTYVKSGRTLRNKALSIIQLAGYMPLSSLAELLSIAYTIRRTLGRGQSLVYAGDLKSMASWRNFDSEEDKRIRRTLTAIHQIVDESVCQEAIIQIARQYARLGEFTKAELIVREIKFSLFRSHGLVEIAALLPEQQQRKLLQDAEDIAATIPEDGHFQLLLSKLPSYTIYYIFEDIPSLLSTIRDRLSVQSVLVEVANQYARLGDLIKAKDMACKIASPLFRSQALAGIAPHLSEGENDRAQSDAIDTINAIPEDETKLEAISRVIPLLSTEKIHDVLMVINTLAQSEDNAYLCQALAKVASRLSGKEAFEMLKQASWIANDIKDEYVRSEGVAYIIATFAQLGQYAEVDYLLVSIQNELLRSRSQYLTACEYARNGRVDEAAELAVAIMREAYRHMAIAEVASRMPGKHAKDFLQRTLIASQTIKDNSSIQQVLGDLALEAVNIKDFSVGLRIVEKTRNDNYRGQTLETIIPSLPAPFLRQAFDAVRVIGDKFFKDRVLVKLVGRCIQTGQVDLAAEISPTIQSPDSVNISLSDIAVGYAKQGNITHALQIVHTISHPIFRDRTLARLAVYLPESAPEMLISDVLASRPLVIDGITLTSEQNENDGSRVYRPDTVLLEAIHRLININDIIRALELLASLKRHDVRFQAILAILPYAPTERHERLKAEALHCIERGDSQVSRYNQEEMLASIIPLLTVHLLHDALALAQRRGFYKVENAIKERLPKTRINSTVTAKNAKMFSEPNKLVADEVTTSNWVKVLEEFLLRYRPLTNIQLNIEPGFNQYTGFTAETSEHSDQFLYDAEAQATVIQQASMGDFSRAVKTILTIRNSVFMCQALAGLAAHLNEPLKSKILKSAIDLAKDMTDADYQRQLYGFIHKHHGTIPNRWSRDLLHSLFSNTATTSRENLVTSIVEVIASYPRLWNAHSINEVFDSIESVLRWWA